MKNSVAFLMSVMFTTTAFSSAFFEIFDATNTEIEGIIIDGPPTPPVDLNYTIVNETDISKSAVILSNVPTSEWTYGCTATSAGMIFGYYDRTGYDNMYTGPANGGVCPLTDLGQGYPSNPRYPIPGSCHIIATEQGLDGITQKAHVDDYWISYQSTGPDPWEGNWPEHSWSKCTADFLGTNQWKWDLNLDGNKDSNTDGATTYWVNTDGTKLYDYIPPASHGLPRTACCHGMRLFAESRGCTVVTNYNQYTNNYHPNGFTFSEFQAEIDAGRPVMIHLAGHSIVGKGYDAATNLIYIHDTWDNNVHSMTWGGSYAGMIMKAVTVIHLAPSAIPQLSYSPTFHNFGTVQANNNYQTTFDIWNSGTGTLTWSLSDNYSWLTYSPTSGSSTGEHDTVTVTIDTAGLSPGSYSGDISISSNGGSGTFTVEFNIPSNPQLAYTPTSYNFGVVQEDQVYQTTFEIWNNGAGTLTWSLSDSYSWLSYAPTSGSSTGEHDFITVTIDTTGLFPGSYSGAISILSNGGNGAFTMVFIIVDSDPPQWRNQGQNKTVIHHGENILLRAQGKDNVALNWAWLSTNETGIWKNFTGNIGWWDISWGYRKQINITNPIIDYQMLITVYLEDGHDDTNYGTIDCENHCNANFSDIRFVANDQTTELPYWLEETGTNGSHHYGRFWLKTNGDSTVYMYYGNPTAIPKSNGSSTFILFDDFSTNSTSAWIHGNSGNHDWYLRHLGINLSSARLRCKMKLHEIDGFPWASTQKFYFGLANNPDITCRMNNSISFVADPDTDEGATESSPREGFRFCDENGDLWSAMSALHIFEGNTYHFEERFTQAKAEGIIWDSSGNIARDLNTTTLQPSNIQYQMVYLDGDNCGDNTFEWVNQSGDNYLKMKVRGSNSGCYGSQEYHLYWFFVSEYADIGPSWNSFGNEQNSSVGETQYGSPLKMIENDEWQWANFTWQNSSIPNGTIIGWKIYFKDTNGNINCTDIMTFKVNSPPVSNFSYNPLNPTTQDIIQFTDLSYDSDGVITNWTWNFGDGNMSHLQNPTHQYGDDGLYNVTLTIMDNDGSNDNITRQINISNVMFVFELYSGWNLITIPVQNSYNASDLAARIGCEMIAWWNAATSTFTTFIVGITPPDSPWDFAINDGIGYYVKVANDTLLSLVDTPLSTVNVTLYTGWNTIGWWKDASTTASSLSGNITNCTMLAMYDAASGSYTVFLVGTPGSPYDFMVERGMGLFAKVTSGSVWHGEG